MEEILDERLNFHGPLEEFKGDIGCRKFTNSSKNNGRKDMI